MLSAGLLLHLLPILGVVAVDQGGVVAYAAFRREFGVERPRSDALSFDARVALFEQRREAVRLHNAQLGNTWVAAMNKFTDFTDAELQEMLGHRPMKRAGDVAASVSTLQLQARQQLPQVVDWSQKLNASRHVIFQGGCGSCWAAAAAGALESHAEIAAGAGSAVPEVSYEQLVDCVQNPDYCGGLGGCGGATSELALEYVEKNGIVARSDYHGGYQSEYGSDGKCKATAEPALISQGFVRLPENLLQPLLEALATKGPVVVSVAAGSWSPYSSGVFNDCGVNATIDHAVLAMGYGTDQEVGSDYWLIRNSWGSDWGENGYIRLFRHSADDDFCGTDFWPILGVGCRGGPATLPVCGMCGVLSDVSYPTGVKISPTWGKYV